MATSMAMTVLPTASDVRREMICAMVSDPPVLAPQRNTMP